MKLINHVMIKINDLDEIRVSPFLVQWNIKLFYFAIVLLHCTICSVATIIVTLK